MSGQRAAKRAKVAAPEAPAPAVPSELPLEPVPGGVSSFLQSWAWKREHRYVPCGRLEGSRLESGPREMRQEG